MKLLAILILSFLTLTILSQESKDYIINLSKDTVFVKVINIDRMMMTVTCEEKEIKIKYKAKDILAVKFDTVFYESGFVKLKGINPKQYIFLYRKMFGKLNLYETKVRKAGYSFSALMAWAKDGTDWGKRRWSVIFFYKRENESRENFSKNWKEKTKDCVLLYDKYNSKVIPWSPTPKELVQFYNTNCK